MSATIVEVRNAALERVGQIPPTALDVQYVERHLGVGAWQVKLGVPETATDAEAVTINELIAALQTPGAGIIISRPGTRPFSGRMLTADIEQDANDPKGTWVFTGLDDNLVGQASRALPDPANAPAAQTQAYDVRSGTGETVMKGYVADNIGTDAPVGRQYAWLTEAADAARGGTAKGNARFDNLAELLTDLGIQSGLGWRFYQSGDQIEFDVYEPVDLSALIRLSVANDTLEKAGWGYSAPGVTDVFVAGQGEGADRTVKHVTTTTSEALASAWGLRFEEFQDARDSDDDATLTARGETTLAEQTATYSVKFTPAETDLAEYGVDWYVGDIVSAIVEGVETPAIVSEVAISINAEGEVLQATLGPVTGAGFEEKVIAKVTQHDQRISNLERNAEATTPVEEEPAFRLHSIVKFTSADSFEKADYPWLRAIRVLVQAGGGGGGGAAAAWVGNHSLGTGGGGGGYAEAFITDIAGLASTVAVTVGAGGSSTSGGAGGTGGSSSFGALVAASGGTGGQVKPNNAYAPYVVAGDGGEGTAGDLLCGGSAGTSGAGADTLGGGGAGGASRLGGGGRGYATGSGSAGGAGNAGKQYGGGGGGGYSSSGGSAYPGGAGAPGVVIVELYA